MAEVFLSYRNTPERRVFVQRLATIFRVHEVTVWWDYGLEAGESYRAQITEELSKAAVVAPLWCAQSVHSKWVAMEAELGKDRLVPARLQKVIPPDAFEAIQAADLVGWDGSVGHPRVLAFVRKICERLGKPGKAPVDMLEELADLRLLTPLPETEAAPRAPATPTHDMAFWRSEWEAHRESEDIVELQAIATHGPDYFAEKARGRLAEIEAQEQLRRRQEAERKRREAEARYRAEGRVPVEVLNGAIRETIWPKPGSGEVFRDCWANDGERVCGPEMVVVPAGSFEMGSPPDEERGAGYEGDEEPQRLVTISAPFAVSRFAVTFEDWEPAAADGGVSSYSASRYGPKLDHRPAVKLGWHDAVAYCAWLTKKTGMTYRLLSEAEWEYVARAGTTTPFWWGRSISTDQANYDGNSTYGDGPKGEDRRQSVAVDSFEPNPWGLYQVHGNVWEWCADTWHKDYNGAPTDGSAWVGSDMHPRVLRGGSWSSTARSLRAAKRFKSSAYSSYDMIGLRVARTIAPSHQ